MDGERVIPVLSVIVPVYNVEGYIERCVESLREQTLREIEILLIDDGSTDGSGRICDEFARTDGRVCVIHKENAGQGLARNKGLEIAKGKYITFVDSDDYVEMIAYAYIVEYMEREQAQLGCFGYEHLSPDGRQIHCPPVKKKIYRGEAVQKEFLLHYFGDDQEEDDLRGVSACMSVFRRDIIKENNIRFQSERVVFSEDTLFNLDYCKYVDCVAVSDRVFYHYCLKSDSFTKGYQANKWERVCYFSKVLERYAREYGLQDKVEHRIRSVLWINLMAAVKQEAGRLGECSYFAIRKEIRRLCNDQEVIQLLKLFDVDKLNRKQKLFYNCMHKKWYEGVFLLSYLRNRRGL